MVRDNKGAVGGQRVQNYLKKIPLERTNILLLHLLKILEDKESVGGDHSKDDGVDKCCWMFLQRGSYPMSTGCYAKPVLRGKQKREDWS